MLKVVLSPISNYFVTNIALLTPSAQQGVIPPLCRVPTGIRRSPAAPQTFGVTGNDLAGRAPLPSRHHEPNRARSDAAGRLIVDYHLKGVLIDRLVAHG